MSGDEMSDGGFLYYFLFILLPDPCKRENGRPCILARKS